MSRVALHYDFMLMMSSYSLFLATGPCAFPCEVQSPDMQTVWKLQLILACGVPWTRALNHKFTVHTPWNYVLSLETRRNRKCLTYVP